VSDSELTCETCRYWSKGNCRVHPPTMCGASEIGYTQFPRTGAEEWCGEYRALKPILTEDMLISRIEKTTQILRGYSRDCAIDGTSVGPTRLKRILDVLTGKDEKRGTPIKEAML